MNHQPGFRTITEFGTGGDSRGLRDQVYTIGMIILSSSK